MVGEPTVSVIIPTYDRTDVLERAIGSVLSQTMADWEMIVVDDASNSDDTAALVEAVGDPRVRIVRRAVNGGVAAAQNDGLEAARARYVSFLHSDDEWVAERLSVLVPVLDASAPDVGGVECGSWVIEPKHTRSVGPYLLDATAADLIGYRAGVHISTLLLRREVACAVRFDDRLRHTEDRDFCVRLLRRSRLAFEPRPLVVIHQEGAGLRDMDKTASCAYLMEKYRDDIEAEPRLYAMWWARFARLAVRAGNAALARHGLRHAVGARPQRVRWWPLLAASYLPDQPFLRSFRGYLAVAWVKREARRLRRRRCAGRRGDRSSGRARRSPARPTAAPARDRPGRRPRP